MFDTKFTRRRQVNTFRRPEPPVRLDDPIVVRWLLGLVTGDLVTPVRIPKADRARVAEWSLRLWLQGPDGDSLRPRTWTKSELASRLARLDIDPDLKPFWLELCNED